LIFCFQANALTAVQINAPHWMHSVVKGERNANLDIIRKSHPDVRIYFRDDHIALEGPPEEVELVRSQIQTVIDDLRNTNTTYLEVDIDPQYYKQLIGKNQIRLSEIQEQTGCDIKFPFDESRHVKLMGTKESVDKARQILLERVQKLSNERTTGISIDPQYYPQIIGSKGKKLEEVRSKFHNIQITFPEANGKSDKVILHGDKEDVEKCSKFLQQKIKDLYSVEIEIPKRLSPVLIGKGGTNIQRLREQMPDVRLEIPTFDDTKESSNLRLSGKKTDVDKARKLVEEHIGQLNISLENSIEQYVTIDSKWHNRFFQNKRKLLNELQQQYGDMLIKLPERNTNSDQVLLRGPKQTIERVQKRLEELVDAWENTMTKEISIPHRHFGYLLAQGGAYIQPIQKEYNVQIKFPPRHNEQDSSNDDTVRIIGRADDIEKAIVALEKMIPVEATLDIPSEAHGSLLGKGGNLLQTLIEQYPDVQITFPPLNSTSNIIRLKGQSDQVEGLKKELLEQYEKYQADKQARSYEVRFIIKPEFRSIIIGPRRRKLNQLKQKYDVNIQISNSSTPSSAVVPTPTSSSNDTKQQHDDQQAASLEENHTLSTESSSLNDVEIVITGYETKALACRDEILKLIKEFESTITMEIDIDHRIHARIIGSGGSKLQQIMKEYEVEIKFPSNNQSDKVHVIGTNQEKIDACIDHLLILEEDFTQDLPYSKKNNSPIQSDSSHGQQLLNTQHRQQEVPSSNHLAVVKPTKTNNKQHRQAPFQVKNAPWTSAEPNGYENQQGKMRNGHHKSPKKGSNAPNRNDLGNH
jgi:predicted PilT family ATPase